MCAFGEGRPARSARGLVAAISRSVAVRVFSWRVWRGYWRGVGEGVFLPPPFFCCCRPFFWIAGRKAAAWGECLVSSFCVKGVAVVAGFHVGVRVRLLAVWCGVVRRRGVQACWGGW